MSHPAVPCPRPHRARRPRPIAEPIEPRVLLSTYTVTNLNFSGAGSLPQAILDADADRGPDLINFAPGVSGNLVLTSLPHISDTSGTTIIQGPGAGVLVISGGGTGTGNGFVIAQGASAVISGLGISSMVNVSSQVGAILNMGELTVSDCTFSNDHGFQGGAIANKGVLNATYCTFNDNSASQSPGGGAIINVGLATISGCTFWKNTSNGAGGAIANVGGSVRLANCTFAGNSSAFGNGGAIYNANSPASTGTTVLTNCTIVGNVGAGGGIYNGNGTVDVNNTIVAGNTRSANGPADDISGTASGSYNLIGTGGSGGLSDGTDANHVGITLDQLRLGALADYGGPTLTMLPVPGSPAVDGGSNALAVTADGQALSRDQRGLARVAGAAVDIGAAEYESAPVNTPHDGGLAPGEFSIRSAVDFADANPGADQIIFDPTVFVSGMLGTILLQSPLSLTDTTGATTITGPGPTVLALRLAVAGQAISVGSGAAVHLRDLTITGGHLGSGRFAGAISNAGVLDLNNCTFTANSTSDTGSAIHNLPGATLTASDCTFFENENCAIYNEAAASLTRCVLTGNSTTGFGGAINSKGTLSVTDSSFVSNTVSGAAITGGAAVCNNGTAVVMRCTFSGNSAPAASEGYGGAIYNSSGSLGIFDSTFVGNSAQYLGGAIENHAALSLVQCTVTGNQAPNGNGIHTSTAVSLNNCIVSGNGRGSTPGYDIFGPVQGSHNLVGSGTPDGLSNGVNGNIVGIVDPKLGPLGNYGGPTQTIPLLPGSPALDAGSNALAVDGSGNPLATDERGLPRIFNGTVDIGAYEVQPPALAGDVNHDGTVNFADLLILAQDYGSTSQPIWEGGDLTGDGSVAFADLLMLAQNYGHAATPVLHAVAANDLLTLKAKHRGLALLRNW